MIIELITEFGTIAPIILAYGLSIIPAPIFYERILKSRTQFGIELLTFYCLGVFVITEVALGIFEWYWTLLMLLILTPMNLVEAFKPTNGGKSNLPKLLEIADESYDDILCFSKGRRYATIAVISISEIYSGQRRNEPTQEEFAELKWLYPFYEESQESRATFTMEVGVDKGISALHFFVSCEDKDWKKSVDKTRRARFILESWLTRKEYEFNIITSNELVNAYSELDYRVMRKTIEKTVLQIEDVNLGVLSVEGVPKSLSSNIGDLIQQLLKMRISGRVIVSFASGSIPSITSNPAEVRVDPQHQPRIPHRMEEHKQRKNNKLMAEIEACEETGAFNVAISVLVTGDSIIDVKSSMTRTSAVIRGVLGGVKVIALKGNPVLFGWNKLILRQLSYEKTSISGVRLTTLLHLPEALSGTPTKILSPEFTLPPLQPLPASTNDSIIFGPILHRGKKTAQVYDIPTKFLCHDTGIFGTPGSGKTFTAFQIVYQSYQQDIPFLVIVPAKKEWRQLGSRIPDIRIFTARDFRFNFMDVPEGVSIASHISRITTCFVATWPSQGIITEHIARVFRKAYSNAGWNYYSNERGRTILLTDLYMAAKQVASELIYSAERNQDFVGILTTRFSTLIEEPMLAVMFNTSKGLSIDELLNHRTILELNDLPDDQKALVTSLIMVGVAEYLESGCRPSGQNLRNLLVLEEAHHVLKRVAVTNTNENHSVQQHAINTLVQLLRESRGLGLGLIMIDQLPGHLAPEAVKLPGVTIIHTLFDVSERVIVGGHANLSDEQLLHIGNMECGEVVIHQAFSSGAVNVQVHEFIADPDPSTPPWTDKRVSIHMENFYNKHPHLRIIDIPIVDLWKPDPNTLWNLKSFTSTPEFKESYRKHLETSGKESAIGYVRELISGHLLEKGQHQHLDQYTELLLSDIRIESDTESRSLFSKFGAGKTEGGL